MGLVQSAVGEPAVASNFEERRLSNSEIVLSV